MIEQHIVTEATGKDAEVACCDAMVDWVCSCGEKSCDIHMKIHIFELHKMSESNDNN